VAQDFRLWDWVPCTLVSLDLKHCAHPLFQWPPCPFVGEASLSGPLNHQRPPSPFLCPGPSLGLGLRQSKVLWVSCGPLLTHIPAVAWCALCVSARLHTALRFVPPLLSLCIWQHIGCSLWMATPPCFLAWPPCGAALYFRVELFMLPSPLLSHMAPRAAHIGSLRTLFLPGQQCPCTLALSLLPGQLAFPPALLFHIPPITAARLVLEHQVRSPWVHVSRFRSVTITMCFVFLHPHSPPYPFFFCFGLKSCTHAFGSELGWQSEADSYKMGFRQSLNCVIVIELRTRSHLIEH
jgi:hypothetical protein